MAQGWSAYLGIFLDHLGITIPESVAYGSSFDLPAFLLVLALTVLVSVGIKESLRVNMALVALKIFIVLFVIFAGLSYVKTSNYSPFIPPSVPSKSGSTMEQPLVEFLFGFAPSAFGISGIFAAASLVFFAYIGFDVVATTAEEAKNPARDLPRGILGSLVICTVLYCATALVLTGMVKYNEPRGVRLARQRLRAGGQAGVRHTHLGGRRRGSHHGRHDAAHRVLTRRVRDVARLAAPVGAGPGQPPDRHPAQDHHRPRAARRHRRRRHARRQGSSS